MKVNIPDAYYNGQLPILDTEVYISNEHIVHNHYIKRMALLDGFTKFQIVTEISTLPL